MTTPAPTAVLWDVGNVIVRWDPRTLYSKIFPDPAERDRFLGEVCTPEWHFAHDQGVTFDENRAPLLTRFPQYAEAIFAWERRWWEMFSGAIPQTEAAIAAVAARGIAQFGLTNMSHETFDETIAISPACAHLGGFIVSGREGVVKPDRAIFDLACDRFGLTPHTTLFVDDNAANVAAAQALGFHVHQFGDPSALEPALKACGLL
jgi:FMN phosphatase YigB (HAD superfamily)